MFNSSLPPVVCRMVHVLFTLYVFVCVQWCPAHIVLCISFSPSCVPYVGIFSGRTLIYVICSYFRIMVSNTYCIVFLFSFFPFILPGSLDYPFIACPLWSSVTFIIYSAIAVQEKKPTTGRRVKLRQLIGSNWSECNLHIRNKCSYS